MNNLEEQTRIFPGKGTKFQKTGKLKAKPSSPPSVLRERTRAGHCRARGLRGGDQLGEGSRYRLYRGEIGKGYGQLGSTLVVAFHAIQ